MFRTAETQKTKESGSKRTLVLTVVWFVLLGAIMAFIAFSLHA